MDDKEKRLSEILNTPRTPEQAQACYAKIQERLAKEKARKKLVLKRVLACAASLILVCAAVLVPLLLKKEELRYYNENLILVQSDQSQFYDEIQKMGIEIPMFNESANLVYKLYKHIEGDVFVGGEIVFECLTDSNYYEGVVSLYIYNVDFDESNFNNLILSLSSDGIIFKYALTSYTDDIYTYNAYATTEDFTIIIEYRAVFDEFTTFIDQLY